MFAFSHGCVLAFYFFVGAKNALKYRSYLKIACRKVKVHLYWRWFSKNQSIDATNRPHKVD
jgi:hypothetical protein